MKKLLRVVAFLMIISMSISTATIKTSAYLPEYKWSDIERIYINSDTELKDMTKTYVIASVDFVNKIGTVEGWDNYASVKIRGNSTAKAEKKPFSIKLNSAQSVFGMEEGKKWNLLANAFDKTLMRNKLCFDLATDMGLKYISQSKYCDVYFNKEYLGNYLVTEPVEAGKNKVDIATGSDAKDFLIELERERNEDDVTYAYTKSGIRFAINEPETPTEEQYDNVKKVINDVETSLKTYRYSEYSKYIDVDSFVNYYIVSEIFKAVDFNYSSTRFYYKDGKLYAGPIWDVDLSSGNASKKFYSAYYSGDDSYKKLHCLEMKWFRDLSYSDEFVKLVNDRLKAMKLRISNLYEDNSLGNSDIKKLINTYGASFNRNYADVELDGAGWSLTKRYSVADNPIGLELDEHPDTYEGSVALLQEWLKNRVAYLEKEWGSIHNNFISELTAKKKSANKVKLEWFLSGVADGVEVYAKPAGGTNKLIKTIKGDSTWSYTAKIKPGVKYLYSVRSFINVGNEKAYSEFSTVSKKIALAKPVFKAKKKLNKAVVTWKKVTGAEGYVVYAGNSASKLKKLKTLKGNGKVKYTKKTSKKYFSVKAYVKVGKKYYYSKAKVKKIK